MKVTLKAARTNAGMTQQQVAERLNIHTNTFIRWEKEPGKIDGYRQAQIVDLLSTEIENIEWTKTTAKEKQSGNRKED